MAPDLSTSRLFDSQDNVGRVRCSLRWKLRLNGTVFVFSAGGYVLRPELTQKLPRRTFVAVPGRYT